MLFSKNDERAGERVLYKTKPNLILSCKKAVIGVVLLVITFIVSPTVIQFIGKMQVYMISQIQLPMTRYAAIAFFVVILVIIVFIIWQLLKWFSVEYSLTDTRIIVKSGLLSIKKNYMPYSTIQDINTSQSFFAKLFDVGTVSVFSAYDNNQILLENISNPSEVEDIIFSNMMGYRNFQEPPRNFINDRRHDDQRYVENQNDDYYDEYEPITPIGHERNNYPRREYEYYPDEFSFQESNQNKYEYEPYDEVGHDVERVMNTSNNNIRYEGSSNDFSNDGRYDKSMDNYPRGRRDYDDGYYNEMRDGHSQNRRDYDDGYYNEMRDGHSQNRRDYDDGYYNEVRDGHSHNRRDYHDADDGYYNEVRDNYSQPRRDYYNDDEGRFHNNDGVEKSYQNEPKQVDDSSEKVIRRHFDKFKR